MRGNESAQILWVEYSDLECPFCKRLHDSGAIKNLETKYGSKLAFAFKHYPLPFHPTALPAALNAECVGEIGGSNKFYAFVESVFIKGTPTQSVIDSVLSEIGVDAKKVQSCVASNKYKEKIDADQSEGSSKFGVNGTPGNVLINTKTGKYEVVSGAQPESNFDAAIGRLLAE
ncbi:thioredoxin domain-containing protein [Candidatus Peribacteria bacterium]|nr:thioredoxin domain-containing protein [Candidatus Peribacteria bacterium]